MKRNKNYKQKMLLLFALLHAVAAQLVLQPPYFDIAKGKNISATATCGENYIPRSKDERDELYCTLASVPGKFGVGGLSCSYCIPGDFGTSADGKDSKDHNIRNANDGSNRWWQSPPLSRGLKYREVNVTIDLGQSFHVAYVIIKAANSPRPGVWALERSNDGGKTYSPWHYFAPSSAECRQYFGVDSYLPIVRDNTVLCSTEYSQIPPFQNGEIHISLINGRPGSTNFSYSTTLQEWTSATNVRLRLLEIKTLLTDLLPLSLDDHSVTRRYYYSIKDISIGGRCMCNGFADECKPTDIVGQYKCNCQYNSVGPRCSECKEGYVQKKWRPRTGNDKFECEKCNCHGHSDECEYDDEVEQRKLSIDINGIYSGGGVCKNCLHNTYGINCEKCKPFFYRPAGVKLTEKNSCQPCNCDVRFSTGLCAEGNGQCECKQNFVGRYCDQCNKGFHMFPKCKPCECDLSGSEDGECLPDETVGCKCKEGYSGYLCNQCQPGYYGYPYCKACECITRYGAIDFNCKQSDGQCRCKPAFSGRQCEICSPGFYRFPYCEDCSCDPQKTVQSICEAGTGLCICKPNYSGPKCEECAPGYYDYPRCLSCECSTAGSVSQECNSISGQCPCKTNYEGFRCQRCKSGYYGYPQCESCDCNSFGSKSSRCDSDNGQCGCVAPFVGKKCNQCQPGFYGFPNCKQCNCNPIGTQVQPGGTMGDCSSNNNGQCVCKNNVNGLECSECKAGYYNLQESNPDGCSGCGCERAGSANGLLSCSESGQCKCREFVTGSKCKTCGDGYFELKDSNMLGCAGCNCNNGGSLDHNCSKSDGQCNCRENISGRKCDEVACNYYFPTLHHIRAEMEDGVTPDGDAIRFDYEENKFPGYTWKGFVQLNDIQPSVIVTVDVQKQSSYQVLFKYSLNEIQPAIGRVSVYKDDSDKSQLLGIVSFAPTQRENAVNTRYVVVKEETTSKPLSFPLNSGAWKIRIDISSSQLLVDHVDLLPEEYSGANDLKMNVQTPCTVNLQNKFCNLYQYVSVDKSGFVKAEAENPGDATQMKNVPLFNNTAVLSKLDYQAMVLLSPEYKQQDIVFSVPTSGKYVAIIQYYHESSETKYLDVYVRSRVRIQKGKVWLYECRYTFGCRQAALEPDFHGVAVFDIKSTNSYLMSIVSRLNATVAVDSVIFIPYEEWNMDYISPKFYCTTKDGKCTTNEYTIPKDTTVVRPQQVDGPLPGYIIDPNVKLMYLQPGVNTIEIGDVAAGRFHIIVHYYQPNHSSFATKTTMYSGAGSGLSGDLKLMFCPNLNGCRGPITSESSGDSYVLESGKARFRIDIPIAKDTWIEYVMLIPEDLPVEVDLFSFKPLRLSQDFLEQCALENYNIKSDATGFCRDSVFSLTTAFNDGALPCKCNVEGSVSSTCECQKFGGQCPCKENVIGRTCTRCKIGYYGFPNCKPCNCSNCDDDTGRCSCPPGVTGENCDRCKSGTFGYDPVIGCQPCNCDKLGTGVDDAVCNVINGKCPCKENYGSRKCSSCAAGYYNFPLCKKCECYSGGVTDEKCNGKTGQCFCQDNVVGVQCDECPNGFFKTRDDKGKQLCTKCWCQGKATKCQEAELYRAAIVTATPGWKVSLSSASVNNISAVNSKLPVAASIVDVQSDNQHIVYWVAPSEFLGDQSVSYGGQLYYYFEYTTKNDQNQPINDLADMIIKSGETKLKSNKQVSRSPNAVHRFQILLNENDWLFEDDSVVTREQMLSVLSKIESLQIRATHDANAGTSTLWNITMDAAVPSGTELIFGIEECLCPKEYTGPSCSKCATGFTRQKYGNCGKCECLGRSDVCNPENGVCMNCTDNTQGNHCEKCKPGFYGDKCKPCECPSSAPANNFANSCGLDVDTTSVICQCKKGYTGLRCEKCEDGYYGQPNTTGGSCKKCLCSGNIDSELTGNCDSMTGKCHKCTDNTDGDQCEKCKPGYYGDAIDKKNCRNCNCNLCGSEQTACNRTRGQCKCKRNVKGSQCDQCTPNTWNFQACQGCEDCGCGPASESKQCDLKTGKCKCLKTVIGRQCDWCELGYYNYSATGCQKCDCGGKLCDSKTGSCDCGLLGEKCTLCPPGHIIENGKCLECDNCVQNILKRVNRLIYNATEIENNIIPPGVLKNVSLGTVNQTLLRLSKDANKFESDLEVLRKAIGFEDYGTFSGYLGIHNTDSFKDCMFSDGPLTNKPLFTTISQSTALKTTRMSTTDLPATRSAETTVSFSKVTITKLPETSAEVTTTTTSRTEASTTEHGSTEPITTELPETTELMSTEITTTEASTTEAATTEAAPAGASTAEASTTEASTTEATTEPSLTEPTTTEQTTTDDQTVAAPLRVGTTIVTGFRQRRNTEKRCAASLSKVLENTHSKFNTTDFKISKLEKEANQSSENGTNTKRRAEELKSKIDAFLIELGDIMSFANTTLGGLGFGTIDADASLAEAERVLRELQSRNFSRVTRNGNREKLAAVNTMIIAKRLMKQAVELDQKAQQFNNTFKNFLEAYRNLKSKSRMTKAHADNATSLVYTAKTIDYKSIIDKVEVINKKNKLTLKDAEEILQLAEDVLDTARNAYQLVGNKTGSLVQLMEELREYVKNLRRDINMTKVTVNDSVNHAKKLRKLADELKMLLQDTKQFAAAAIRAAKVYGDIVNAIYDALAAARMSNETVHEANTKAIAAKDDAVVSKNDSESVNINSAQLAEEVKKTIKVSLAGIKMKVAELRGLREIIQGRIDQVKDEFTTFNKEKEVGEKAKNVSDNAFASAEVAQHGQDLVNQTEEQLARDKRIVEDLKKDIRNINNLIKEVSDNVTKVEETIPTLNATIAAVNRQHDNIEETIKNNVTNSIEYVKYLIGNARSIADHMPLAMELKSDSELILDSPKAARDSSIYNKISLVFSSEGDGPLFFIGSENGDASARKRRQITNEKENSGFLSLEIFSSQIVFRFKLNTGPVISVVNPKKIEKKKIQFKDTLYKVVAISNFGFANLTVANIEENAVDVNMSTVIKDTNIVSPLLNLGKNSNVYVGSIPDGTPIPAAAFESGRDYNGMMDEVVFNDELMGLWDWKSQKNIDGAVRGSRPVDTGVYCFDGDGFVQLSVNPSSYALQKLTITFSTLEKDGLIFLGMDPPKIIGGITSQNPIVSFYALEIKDGYLMSKFDFGNGFRRIFHKNGVMVNDGKPHRVIVRAKTKKFVRIWLDTTNKGPKLDEVNLSNDVSHSKHRVTEVYVGGTPMRGYLPNGNITTKGFIGCIGTTSVKGSADMHNVVTFNNYRKGYAAPIGHSASFPTNVSYLAVPSCSLQPSTPFGFSFQTYEEDGVLVYAKGKDASLEISLVDAQVKVDVLINGESSASLISNVKGGLSDGKWHAVSLYLEEISILLYLGTDRGFVKSKAKLSQPEVIFSGNMYLGGKDTETKGFNGNIRQVYCSDKERDLSKAELYNDAIVGSLKLVAPIPLEPMITTTMVPATAFPDPGLIKPVTTEATTAKVTTSQPTTPEQTTTTPKPTTLEQITTTLRSTTSEQTTSTLQQTTPEQTTTTPQPLTPKQTTTTQKPTTAEQITTTPQPAATEQTTTTPQPTTTEQTTATQQPTTPMQTTTTLQPTTPDQTTTTLQPTIPEQSTTTPQRTTTEQTTTTPRPTTAEQTTTTQQPTTPMQTTKLNIGKATVRPNATITRNAPVTSRSNMTTMTPLNTTETMTTTFSTATTVSTRSNATEGATTPTRKRNTTMVDESTTASTIVKTTVETSITSMQTTVAQPNSTKKSQIDELTTTKRPQLLCTSSITPLSNAIGFGTNPESYVEFGVKNGELDSKSQFEFNFYTLEQHGLLLTVNMKTLFDYEAVFLNNGKITYLFSAGTGAMVITSKLTYNDGKWHKVTTRRAKKEGFLTVDDKLIGTKTTIGGATSVNHISKIFVGGAPVGETLSARIPTLSRNPLKGGMKGFKSFDEALVPAEQKGTGLAYDGLPITDAVSVDQNGGHLAKFKSYKVGEKFEITLDVRSRNKTGYIFYVFGGGDWLSLFIEKDGKITADCNNGGGRFSVTVDPPLSVCNGEFHSILLEKVAKTLTLTVDGTTATETTEKSSSSADTKSPLYFGGVPESSRPRNYHTFTGCITAVKINGEALSFDSETALSGAAMRGCPEM